jgi:pimeloyl-ACP methyl ester carboxylesterase/putative sterol carrier protein
VAIAAEGPPGPLTAERVGERIATLRDRFRPEAAHGLVADYSLSIDGACYEISISRGRCTVEQGKPSFPHTRIRTDGETWLALDEGSLSSIDAFLEGRVEVRGNLEYAVRLPSLFEFSGRPRTSRDLAHTTFSIGRHRLSAFVLGRGEPVLLLHGLGANKLSWLPLMGPLAERYGVIAVDLPGHGGSSKRRGDHTPAYFAAVVRRLLDELQLDRVALAGNSMGGRIALEVSATVPDRVSALVLLGPALAGLPIPFIARFLHVVPAEIGALPLPLRRRIVARTIRSLYAVPERLPDQAYRSAAEEFIRVYGSGRARTALLSSVRGLVRDRPGAFWERVRQNRAPTLVVWGEEDRLVPVRLGRRLAEEMRGCRLEVLPGVGHVPQFEVPEVTADLVRRFLDRVLGTGPRGGRPGTRLPEVGSARS